MSLFLDIITSLNPHNDGTYKFAHFTSEILKLNETFNPTLNSDWLYVVQTAYIFPTFFTYA